MYIPTGWYPSALAVTGTAAKYRLWITNAKGIGPSMGYNGSVFFNGSKTQGTLNVVDLPVAAKVANRWTAAVVSNDSFADAEVSPCAPGRGVRVSQVLCPPKGKRSPLKHVVFVVTENKTFDQYFGDLPAGDNGYRGDPTYTLYGQSVTPNHHKLAGPYSLGDNFFSDAEVSVTGHSWTSGAVATDHNEKTWQADYDEGIRGSHGNGDPLKGSVGGAPGKAIQQAEDELNDPEGGYLFEAFKRAGATPPSDHPGKLSMAIYGESTARTSTGMDAYKAPGWKDGDISYSDTCRVLTLRDGKAPDGPSPAFSVGSAPAGFATNDCDGRTLATPFTLKHWADVYTKTGRDIMPSFIYMSLPQNHTLATKLGNPTPQSMVADNDYALGLLIDSLSQSPFWKSTAVLQTEDDTQVAGDHISACATTYGCLALGQARAQPPVRLDARRAPHHRAGLRRQADQPVRPAGRADARGVPDQDPERPLLVALRRRPPARAVRHQRAPESPDRQRSMAMDWSVPTTGPTRPPSTPSCIRWCWAARWSFALRSPGLIGRSVGDGHHVADSNRCRLVDHRPHAEGAAVVLGQGLEYVQITVEVRLWSGDHRAAGARGQRPDGGGADGDCVTAPAVLEPVVAVRLNDDVGRNWRESELPPGYRALPARKAAVVTSRIGRASTKRPGGIVQSNVGLASSSESLNASAVDAGSSTAATSRTSDLSSSRQDALGIRVVGTGDRSVGQGQLGRRGRGEPPADASSSRGSCRPVRILPVASLRTPHDRSPTNPLASRSASSRRSPNIDLTGCRHNSRNADGANRRRLGASRRRAPEHFGG